MPKLPLNSIGIDFISSIGDGRYPNLITSPAIRDIIVPQVSQRVSGLLMVADIGVGGSPISSNLFSAYDKGFKTFAIDHQDFSHIKGDDLFFTQVDMRDSSALNETKKQFFKKFRSSGKSKFDVIILSNVLNYFVQNNEALSYGEVSSLLKDFWCQFIETSLSSKGLVLIQNGGKRKRYKNLDESQVNDYFSYEMESIITKMFQDIFYLGVAIIEEKKGLFKRTQLELGSFGSLNEYEGIKRERKISDAFNVRVLIRR